jgi:hypothetical protein
MKRAGKFRILMGGQIQVARMERSRAQLRHLPNSSLQPESELLRGFGKHPAGKKGYAQKAMNSMVHLSEV